MAKHAVKFRGSLVVLSFLSFLETVAHDNYNLPDWSAVFRRSANAINWVRERSRADQLQEELNELEGNDESSSFPQKLEDLERCTNDEKQAELAVSSVDGELSGLRKVSA